MIKAAVIFINLKADVKKAAVHLQLPAYSHALTYKTADAALHTG